MRSVRGKLCAGIAVLGLALAGCGADDEPDSGETAPIELTAKEFLPLLAPEKKEAVGAVLRATPGCDEVSPDISLVLLVSDEAGQADPETPLADLVKDHC
ncbi:MAG: hypothetical protein M3331_06105 [Actinomycetota bacterium]|nr:hypothetical protein [Actinomycetota bacterium]